MQEKKAGRVVVVTGGSAGVGRATARAFAMEGAHVAVIARDTEGLHAAAREVEKLSGKGLAVAADVANPDQVDAAAARIEQELGPIDVWVNNAMTTVFGRVSDVTPEEFKRATEVTYLGTVYGTMSALRRMLGRNSGKIIQVGSALAYQLAKLLAVPMHFNTTQIQAGVLIFWLLPSICAALCLLAAPGENRGIA